MNGLSDVRLKLYGAELERQALCRSMVRARPVWGGSV